MQHLHVLRFTGQHVNDVHPAQVTVLQIRQFFAEHDRAGGAIAIDQGEQAFRLFGQDGAHVAQDRRDAGTGGEARVMFPVGRRQRHMERARRRHDLQGLPGLDGVIGPGGKHPLCQFANADPDRLIRRRADRIRPAHFPPADFGFQRQMLTGAKGEGSGQIFGHSEGQHHGVAEVFVHGGNPQGIEPAHRRRAVTGI